LARPDALRHLTLEPQHGAGLDPCAALQVECVLNPGEQRTLLFLLGQGTDADHVRKLIETHGRVEAAAARSNACGRRGGARSRGFKSNARRFPRRSDESVAAVSDISCRLWSGRATTSQRRVRLRDQLQDVMALFHARPELAGNIC
jgi:cellobiose phosphorylase